MSKFGVRNCTNHGHTMCEIHPSTVEFLRCLHANDASNNGTSRILDTPADTMPEPLGPSICCRCGRARPRKARLWLDVGAWTWCADCKRRLSARPHITRAKESLKCPS